MTQAALARFSQNFKTWKLTEFKIGAVFLLKTIELRLTDCFDPPRVELWILDLALVGHDRLTQSHKARLQAIDHRPAVQQGIQQYLRLRNSMAGKAEDGCHASSPLKSQRSDDEEHADTENREERQLSQLEFSTQVPHHQTQRKMCSPLRDKRWIDEREGGLLDLLKDPPPSFPTQGMNRSKQQSLPKPIGSDMICSRTEVVGSIEEMISQFGRENSLEPQPRPSPLAPSLPVQQLMLEDPSAADEAFKEKSFFTTPAAISPEQGEASVPAGLAVGGGVAPPLSNTLSGDTRPSHKSSRSFQAWRHRLSNKRYLPHFAKKIAQDQDYILNSGDSWQPPLVGRPMLQGMLPVELLNRITSKIDEAAEHARKVVTSRQSLPDEASSDEEPDEAKLPTAKHLENISTTPVSWSETPVCSEVSGDVEGSLSPSQDFPHHRNRLPPDSSPPDLPCKAFQISPSPKPKDFSNLDIAVEPQPLVGQETVPSHNAREHEKISELIAQQGPCESSCETPLSSPVEGPSKGFPFITARRIVTSYGKDADRKQWNSHRNRSPESRCISPMISAVPSKVAVLQKSATTFDSAGEKTHHIEVKRTPYGIKPLVLADTRLPHGTPSQCSSTSHSSSGICQHVPQSSFILVPGTFKDTLPDSHVAQDPRILRSQIDDLSGGGKSFVPKHASKPIEDAHSEDGQSNRDKERMNAPQQIMSDVHGLSKSCESGGDDALFPATALSRPSNLAASCSSSSVLPVLRSFDAPVVSFQAQSSLLQQAKGLTQSKRMFAATSSSPSSVTKRRKTAHANAELSDGSFKSDSKHPAIMAREERREWLAHTKEFYESKRPISSPPNSLPQQEMCSLEARNDSQRSSVQRSAEAEGASTPPTHPSIHNISFKAAESVRASRSDLPVTPFLHERFRTFRLAYWDYSGTHVQFLKSCRLIKRLQLEEIGTLPPPSDWDEFVFQHHHSYRKYLQHMIDDMGDVLPYEEYYKTLACMASHLEGIIQMALIDQLEGEQEICNVPSDVAIATQMVVQSAQRGKDGRSIAASSPMRGHDCSTTSQHSKLESNQLQRKAMEDHLCAETRVESRQSQSSRVEQWLEKPSGAASPELGSSVSPTKEEQLPILNHSPRISRSKADSFITKKAPQTISQSKQKHWQAFQLRERDTPFRQYVRDHEKLASVQRSKPSDHDVQKIVDIFSWRP